MLPVYKAWPAYTAGGTRERSLASTLGLAHRQRTAPSAATCTRTREPGDAIYAIYADASLYLAAGRRSPYPYLWFLGIEHIPGALQRLRDTLAGPAAPRYIAVYQQPRTIDKRGDASGAPHRRYRHVRRSRASRSGACARAR